jgi:hypothetical protein
MADNVSLIVNETIDNVVINPSITNNVVDVNVTGTDTYVDITVTPNLTTVNINQINAGVGNVPVGGTAGQVLAKIDSANYNTEWVNQSGGGGGGSQDLQSVTDIGATTTNGISINTIGESALNISTANNENNNLIGIYSSYNASGDGATTANYFVSNSSTSTEVGNSWVGKTVSIQNSSNGSGLEVLSEGKSIVTYNDIGTSIEINSGTSNNGLEINSGTSSTGLPIRINKNGIDQLTINQAGQLSVVKIPNGTSSNFLMADGSTYSLNNINSKQLQLNYLDSDNSLFDAFYLRVLNDSGTFEASNQLLSSLALLRSISYVNQGYTQQLNADKFVKLGGTSAQFLMADGSTSTSSGGSATLQNSIASGTDTYTATISGVTSYVDGAGYLIRFTNGNTQTSTLNINGLGARTLYRNNDGQLIGGDIEDLGEMLLIYSSALSAFKCIGTSPNDIISYVTNADSVTITKGQPVYAFGGTGDRMTVKLAYNTLDATSAQTVGLVMSTSIVAGQKGYIITQGLLDGLSTLSSPFIDGDTVYLGATAGTITRVKPSAPNHLVYLGVVTTASAGAAGRMYVRPQNGYELDEIHDVSIVSKANNDIIAYDSATSLWKNKSISTVLGYTPVASNTAITGATNTKITYDSKGLITAGTTLIASDIPTIAQSQVTNLTTDLAAKQATLVSATNIKTVNGNTLLGSGDLVISGSSAQTGTIIVLSTEFPMGFKTPANITTSTVFIIELVGAGGGGAGGLASNGHGSAGGGGGYVYEKITGLSPSTTYTCAIGTGGAGGAAVSNGTAGGSTTLTIGAATFTASGGGGGIATLGSAGGAGGTGTATGATPDIAITGQSGDYTALTTAATVHSSRGGGSPKGWGLGGAGVGQSFNGLAGSGYGGGGSSGKGGTFTGGAGSNGIIYCQYYN